MTAPRRLPIALLLVAVVLVAIVVGDPDDRTVVARAEARDVSAVAAEGARSIAWFCPGLPVELPLEQQVVAIANVGDAVEPVELTLHPDDGSAPVRRTVEVAPLAVTVLARVELGPAGPLVVETFSRDVVVESRFAGDRTLASDACATTTATTRHFAAGTTVRGVTQYLVLFNPLASDAKVDITLRTSEGVVAREALRSLDVGRRSRRVVPIHDFAVRQERVAVSVEATAGRVVAEQVLVFGPDSGRGGVATSPGVLAPAADWVFAEGTTTAGAATVVAIANGNVVDAEVDVVAIAGPDVLVEPVTLAVPRDGIAWVQVGACGDPPAEGCVDVPAGTVFALGVVSDPDTPVVAEVMAQFTGEAADVAVVAGTASPAPRWVLAGGRPAEGAATVVAVANPGVRPVTFDVALVQGGAVSRPEALQGVEVASGQRTGVDLGAFFPGDAALVVTASGPVVVERVWYAAGGVARSLAVPDRAEP